MQVNYIFHSSRMHVAGIYVAEMKHNIASKRERISSDQYDRVIALALLADVRASSSK